MGTHVYVERDEWLAQTEEIAHLKAENERLREQREAFATSLYLRIKDKADAERWRKAKKLEAWRISVIISKHHNDGIDADAAIDAAREGEKHGREK